MIPVLYESTESAFTTQGIGTLKDTASCIVTEERNGIYELEMTYPQNGIHFADIKNGNIILAIPSPYRDAQPFRIYKVTKPLNGIVTVYANHISYDLNKIPVHPFSESSASAAMIGLKSHAAISHGFTFWTDKTTEADFTVEVPTACRSCLGGQTGSILDVFGGEYEWDRFTVRLYNKRGTDTDTIIKYGKNLTGLTQEGDISSLVSGIYPYWKNEDNLVVCSPPIIYAIGSSGQTAIPVDFSDKFSEAPTPAQLKAAAERYIKSNDIGKYTASITVKFIQLEKMSGIDGLALLERCDLCDTVTIQYEGAGIDAEAEIVSIKTNVLLERYEQMEVGSIRANIAQTIADQASKISQNKQETMTFMQRAISNATSWITGGRGGYVVFQLNANGQPEEILIMDTPNIETARKIWRWNQGGLGYSNKGYNGPYTTAITQDGAIVANFITAGTMLANIIQGGTLTLGGTENGRGVLIIRDAAGKEIGRWDKDGIKATIGNFSGDITGASGIFNGILQVVATAVTGNNPVRIKVPGTDDDGVIYYTYFTAGTDGFVVARNRPTNRKFIRMYVDTGDGIPVFSGGSFSGFNETTWTMTGIDERLKIHGDGEIKTPWTYNNRGSSEANVHINGSQIFQRTGSSSKRYKKYGNTKLDTLDPAALYDLPVRRFKYKKGYLAEGDQRADQWIIGFFAEEIAEIYPCAAEYEGGEIESWNSRIMLPAMLKLIQEQHEQLMAQEGKIKEQDRLMAELDKRLKKLEKGEKKNATL